MVLSGSPSSAAALGTNTGPYSWRPGWKRPRRAAEPARVSPRSRSSWCAEPRGARKAAELHRDTKQPRRHVPMQNISTDATFSSPEPKLETLVKRNLEAETSVRKRVFSLQPSRALLASVPKQGPQKDVKTRPSFCSGVKSERDQGHPGPGSGAARFSTAASAPLCWLKSQSSPASCLRTA